MLLDQILLVFMKNVRASQICPVFYIFSQYFFRLTYVGAQYDLKTPVLICITSHVHSTIICFKPVKILKHKTEWFMYTSRLYPCSVGQVLKVCGLCHLGKELAGLRKEL